MNRQITIVVIAALAAAAGAGGTLAVQSVAAPAAVEQPSAAAAPAEPPVMSAEAMSYTLDAEALAAASIESRRAVAENIYLFDAAAENMEPDDRRAWEFRVESLRRLIADMDAADAAVITTMQAAAADGTVTAAERADVEAAQVTATQASHRANSALTAMTPELQAATMDIMIDNMLGGMLLGDEQP